MVLFDVHFTDDIDAHAVFGTPGILFFKDLNKGYWMGDFGRLNLSTNRGMSRIWCLFVWRYRKANS